VRSGLNKVNEVQISIKSRNVRNCLAQRAAAKRRRLRILRSLRVVVEKLGFKVLYTAPPLSMKKPPLRSRQHMVAALVSAKKSVLSDRLSGSDGCVARNRGSSTGNGGRRLFDESVMFA